MPARAFFYTWPCHFSLFRSTFPHRAALEILRKPDEWLQQLSGSLFIGSLLRKTYRLG